jgi:hypothetical protein
MYFCERVTEQYHELKPGRKGDLIFEVTFQVRTGINALEYRRSNCSSVFKHIIIAVIASLRYQIFQFDILCNYNLILNVVNNKSLYSRQ